MATNDDFYSLSGTALGSCNDLKSVLRHSYVLPVGGICSFLCYLYIFHMYYIIKSPILKRHPTPLAVYRCIFEFIFIQQYIWLPFIDSRHFYDNSSLESGGCRANTTAAVLSFISQFSLLGGEVWFFSISWDLRTAYTNPFASYEKNRIQYTLGAVFVAWLTAMILMLFGPNTFGVAAEGVIWIQNRRSQYNGAHPNYAKVVLFYSWMAVIYLYSIFAIYKLSLRLRKGFAETLSAKLSIIERARTYVMGYTIFWGVLLTLELASYLSSSQRKSRVLITAVAYGFSFRGVYSLGIILYSNWNQLCWTTLYPFGAKYQRNLAEVCVREGLLLKPHLNSALRTEILYFTTQGIMYATQECDKYMAELKEQESTENNNGSNSTTTQVATPASRFSLSALGLLDRKSIRLSFGAFRGTSSSNINNNNSSSKSNHDDNSNTSNDERTNTFSFKDKMDLSTASSIHSRGDIERIQDVLSLLPINSTKSLLSSSSQAAPSSFNTNTATATATTGNEVIMMPTRSTYIDISKINELQVLAVAEEEGFEAETEASKLGLLDILDEDSKNDPDIEASQPLRSSLLSNNVHQVPFGTVMTDNGKVTRSSITLDNKKINTKKSRPLSFIETINPFHRRSSIKEGQTSQTADSDSSNLNGSYHQNNSNLSGRSVSEEIELPEHPIQRAMSEDRPLSLPNPASRNSSKPIEINKVSKHASLRINPISYVRNMATGSSRESETSTNSNKTIKWRDTMDIEFTMNHHEPNTTGNNLSPSRPASTDIDGSNSSTIPSTRINSFDVVHNVFSSVVNSVSDVASSFASAIMNPDYDQFKFKDFNPLQFARIRAMCGISAEEYSKAFLTTTKESFSEGRSGAFLFFSSNERFIVKSTSKDEILVLQRILKKYEEYLKENPHSLLIRFLGAHCITMYGQDLYFVIMMNVFPLTQLSERYDLKGSWVNRHRVTSLKKSKSGKNQHLRRREKMKDLTSAPLLFDNDIQQKITLVPSVANCLATQIAKDIIFLKDQGLMDYSLLVGVKRQRFEVLKESADFSPTDSNGSSNKKHHRRQSVAEVPTNGRGNSSNNNNSDTKDTTTVHIDPNNPYQRMEDGGISAAIVEGPGTFYFGIIDVLQEWNYTKKLERFFKVQILGVDGDGVSAIEPEIYASRFYNGAVLDFLDGIDEENNHLSNPKNMPTVNETRRQYRRSIRGSVVNISHLFSSHGSSPTIPSRRSKSSDSTLSTSSNPNSIKSSIADQDEEKYARENASTTYIMKQDKSFTIYTNPHPQRSRSITRQSFISSNNSTDQTVYISSSNSSHSGSFSQVIHNQPIEETTTAEEHSNT